MPTTAEATRTFEFWLGRAGSGKTWACLDSIARHLIERPRGEPLLFLVPEQASASIEHALAERLHHLRAELGPRVPRGYTRARILSFRLLQEEVFARTGGRPAGIVDEHTRVLLLRRAIHRRRTELRLFSSSAELPGLAASLGRTLDEFQRFGWRPEDLHARIDTLGAAAGAHEVLRRKLSDLALIWEAYLGLLGELGYADLPARAGAAAERLAQWDALRGARVWIDGFASFNEQELRLLDALLTHACWGCLALCLDPFDEAFIRRSDPAAAIPETRPRVGPQRTFEILEETYLQLRSRLRGNGWHTRDETLPRSDVPTRFAASPALETLELDVLTALRGPDEKNAGWPASTVPGAWPSGPIELLEAPDRRQEVEAVARRIAALCVADRSPRPPTPAPYDPSHIIVLTRDLDPYAPLVREIFPRYGIPFFIDATRSLDRHPLARLLLTALRHARAGGWTSDLALDYLKTGLAPLADPDPIAQIERIAVRRRLQHRDWNRMDHWLPRGMRDNEPEHQRVAALFEAWRAAAAPVESLNAQLRDPAVDPARALATFLIELRVEARVNAWIEDCRERGDEETLSIHERALSNVETLLLRLHEIGRHGQSPPTPPSGGGATAAHERIDELEEILDAALRNLRGRLIPPSQEQVIVGQIDRSRTPLHVRAAFVLGLADGEFPRAYDEDPILGDRERRALTRDAAALGPDSAHRFSMERFFAYIALTRASEWLVATRPLQGEQGRALQPSAPFRAIAEAFPAAGPRSTREDAPEGARALPERPEAWISRTTREFHRAALGDPAALDRLIRAPHPLARLRRIDPAARPRIETALRALAWPPPARLDPALSRLFWQARPQLSATGLEDYGACPFKFFASRMLRLERPLDPTPGPLELGELRHALLEALFKRLGNGAPVRWGSVDVAAAAALVDELAPGIAADRLEERFGREALTQVLLADAVEDIKTFLRVLRRMGERYGFVQVAAEYTFGPRHHAPLRLPVGEGLEFVLRGSVDRVDAEPSTLGGPAPHLILYDFKSSAQTAQHAAPRYLHGLSLQLALYALALRRNFTLSRPRLGGAGPPAAPARVSGFFYWPLSLGTAQELADDPAEPASDAWFARHRAKGLFDARIVPLLDTEVAPGGRSLAFGFSLKKDGELNKTAFGPLEHDGFDRFLRQIERLIADRAAQIAAGRIDVAPLASPLRACEMCEHAPVCRVATAPPEALRYLPSLRPSRFRDQFVAPEPAS